MAAVDVIASIPRRGLKLDGTGFVPLQVNTVG
jgi:hypothetical protein